MASAKKWDMRGEEHWQKSRSLGGDWNVSRAALHELDITFGVQLKDRSYRIPVAWWLAQQDSTAKVLVQFPGGQNLNPLYLLKWWAIGKRPRAGNVERLAG